MTKLPISVCLIAGNEAHRLGRTLEIVKAWVSEIVLVIDDKVTDGTDKVGESHGARVFCRPWRGHAVHRNFATAQATQPWILAIDADEVVSDQLRQEILALFQAETYNDSAVAYSFPRLSFFCGRWIRHGNWYPDRKVRLWRKGDGEWQGSPHEKLVIQGNVRRLRGSLLHFSNESIDQLLGKIGPVSTLQVNRAQAQGRRAGWVDLLARPWWKFFRAYVIRRGFLDGWQGYFIVWMESFSTVTRYAKAIDSQQTKPSLEALPQQAYHG